MLGHATGAVVLGVDARLVLVEADLGGGLPSIAAVGLPDAAVREGIDRLRAALPHAGFTLPQRRLILNLAPAELRKHGASLDLPMAYALLMADGQLPPLDPADTVMAGELSLDGSVRPVRGVLPMALAARVAGRRRIWVPAGNADEAALVEGLEVIAVSSLIDVRAIARGVETVPHRIDREALLTACGGDDHEDLADVRGQPVARRALEIAAAGGHHLLLRGTPGSGKSMLARRLPGILPPLDLEEALEVTRVWSAAGLTRGLVARRPFRAPHHGASSAALVGGGPLLKPGEMSLAHHGVLYMDEFPEFRRDALESLRQPLEDGSVRVIRVHASTTFPTRFTLVASMNPCPCGYHGDPRGRCRCSERQVQRYLARLSGPLLDRFDITVDLPPVAIEALVGRTPAETSTSVRRRVERARAVQARRLEGTDARVNARLGPRELAARAELSAEAERLLVAAATRLDQSARGFDRVRRVARTVADLAGSRCVESVHVAEALQYRPTEGTG